MNPNKAFHIIKEGNYISIFNLPEKRYEYKVLDFENPTAEKSTEMLCALMNRAFELGYESGSLDRLTMDSLDEEEVDEYIDLDEDDEADYSYREKYY